MRIRLLFIICFFSTRFIGQEVISEVSSNPELFNKKSISQDSKTTISLPFMDDFSYNYSTVISDLWEESSVFVNRTYPINPPTIGVATFDGLDENGFARDLLSSGLSEPSDTLLSKKIDLLGISEVFFMFYYQGKGIGDEPQLQDKLILEFLNDTVWNEIWSSNGQTMTEFKKEVIIIDSIYLTNNFQFRFRNYATISGNFDHWHIDYIKLDELQNSSDTSILNDVSFVYNSSSFLKRYSEMPWTHFINNEASELKDTIDLLIRNNDASINVDYQYNVLEDGNLLQTFPNIGAGWRNYTIYSYDSIGNFSHNPTISIDDGVFTSFQVDSVNFVVQNVIATSPSDNKQNDTLYHTQRFHHHFAYDDGIAESAYGLNIDGAKIAYQFKLNRPDEKIRAVQMYFPQMHNSVTNIPFKLTVWKDSNGQPGDTLYTQNVNPVHTSDGAFHTYFLDHPFLVSGIIYIGWEQMTDDLLNIGFDKNNIANDYMFYNIGNGWNNSNYPGAWMIRPVVSKNPLPVSVNDLSSNFKLYPNPAISELFIETDRLVNVISVFNLQGVLLNRITSNTRLTKININDLSSAIYIVEVANNNSRSYKKFLVD